MSEWVSEWVAQTLLRLCTGLQEWVSEWVSELIRLCSDSAQLATESQTCSDSTQTLPHYQRQVSRDSGFCDCSDSTQTLPHRDSATDSVNFKLHTFHWHSPLSFTTVHSGSRQSHVPAIPECTCKVRVLSRVFPNVLVKWGSCLEFSRMYL